MSPDRLPGLQLHWRVPARSRAAVTVVMPSYNYGRYLGAAVESVLSQESVEPSVVIVDDASEDDSGTVARSLARRFDSVVAIVHEQNMGHLATYNDGLGRTSSDYVLLLSADDLLAPGALARAVGILERHPQVGLVYGFAPGFRGHPPRPRKPRPHYLVWPGERWLTRVCRRAQNPVCTPSAVMRRTVLEEVGPYDLRLPHTADLLMWLRAATVSDVAYVTGADQAFYRLHDANMHSTSFADMAVDVAHRRETFRIFFEESPQGRTDPRRRLVQLALEREAQGGSLVGRWCESVVDPVGWRLWRQFGVRL